ncbi:hypothetical protein [Brevibacillus formosus]|uniref:hypothetical protein n=1 Tax=Brevibacillus formosus TaxID=54913 RepID=UPI0012FDC1FD|nr:hypothetical protein [Brevibacillus formosus]
MFDKLKNLWIDKPDEKITVRNSTGKNNKITVTGMKYKCYLKDKEDYTWVISGTGGRIIAFEQGIKWNNERLTEKWLHDSWLRE